MRCPYCGNENPGDHRFCGMCGRPLVEAPTQPVVSRPEPARGPEPPTPAPAYTGGLFNLNAPSDKSSSNLDYLLDDEDEPKSSKGLILLTIVALAMVVGLGWLRWRNGGLPFLRSMSSTSPAKPSAAPDASTGSPATPPIDPSIPPADSSATPTPAATPEQSSQPPATTSSTTASTPVTPLPATSSSASEQSTPAPSTPAEATASPATVPAAGASAAESPKPAEEKPADKPAAVPSPAAAATSARDVTPAAPKPKPAARPAPSKATDPVALGERYLYGREGFPQNCERGLHYVKPAADQSNPKAMITMGALYATGHCLSRDLPIAYRFFALALREDPENGALRQNAEMVWKQMTAEERKQAIRLTQ